MVWRKQKRKQKIKQEYFKISTKQNFKKEESYFGSLATITTRDDTALSFWADIQNFIDDNKLFGW